MYGISKCFIHFYFQPQYLTLLFSVSWNNQSFLNPILEEGSHSNAIFECVRVPKVLRVMAFYFYTVNFNNNRV